MTGPIPLQLGDILKLKKPHACGANSWEVVRLGADIRIKCTNCGRRVMMRRSRLERKITNIQTADERNEQADKL